MAEGDGAPIGKAIAKIGLDSAGVVREARVIIGAGKDMTKALVASSKEIVAARQVELAQIRQATTVVRAQQQQITAATRAESSERIALARAEASAKQQAAKVAAAQQIEAERRITATHRAEIRAREAAARAEARAGAGGGAGGSLGLPLSLGGRVLGGIGLAVAAKQAVQYGAEAAQLAGQNERVEQSFVRLAASVNQSSADMLQAMKLASRGLVADSELILSANQAIISGVADNAEELTQLLEVAAARAAATGRTTQEAFSRLVTGIARREVEVLDELGLRFNLNEVYDSYAKSIGTTANALTEAQKSAAIFNRVISDSQSLVDAASNRTLTAGDKYEKFGTSVTNAKDAVGDLINALGTADAAGWGAGGIDKATEAMQRWADAVRQARAEGQVGVAAGPNALTLPTNIEGATAIRDNAMAQRQRVMADIAAGGNGRELPMLQRNLADLNATVRAANITISQFKAGMALATGNVPGAPPWLASVQRAQGAAAPSGRTTEQNAAILENNAAVAEIESNAQQQRIAATQQYESQRAQVISQYGVAMARESEDFQRQRANQERKLALSIIDIHQDAARQRVRWEADLARSIQQARADSAEQVTDWERDRDERIAEARADSAERIAGIEERFNRDREKRQRDFAERIRDAAANLDAVAVRELQRQQREENEEAARARDEAIADERESLQESIGEINKAHARRLEDEAEALDKSIRQQQEAHQRRLEDQAENDRLRIEDMKNAFEEQKAQEDIERGIRLKRQAEDHQAQLTALATAHNDRIKQIGDQERELKQDQRDAFLARLKDLGLFHTEWLNRQKKQQEDQLKLFDAWWEAMGKRFEPGKAPSLANPHAAVPGGVKYPDMKIPGGLGPISNDPFAPKPGRAAEVAAARDMRLGVDSRMFETARMNNYYPAAPMASSVAGSTSRSVTVGDIHPTIVIGDLGGRSDEEIMGLVEKGLINFFEDMADM